MANVARAIDTIYARVSGTSSKDNLRVLLSEVSGFFADGKISQTDYDEVANLITSKISRVALRRVDIATTRAFPRRIRQRSPDREKSRDRRRMFGRTSIMPPRMRSCYTEGESSALYFVAECARSGGFCDWPIDKIAAKAGVCRTTVQNAMHEARRLGHVRVIERPQRGAKSLTNIVEIVSIEWKVWLNKRGWFSSKSSEIDDVDTLSTRVDSKSTAAIGSKNILPTPPKTVSTTESSIIRRAEPGP